MRTFQTAWFGVAAATLAGCVAPPDLSLGTSTSVPLQTRDSMMTAVPGGVTLGADGAATKRHWTAPADAGLPIDAAIDPSYGHGALAFERGLAFFDIDAQQPVWCSPPGFDIRRIVVLDRMLMACGEHAVAHYALEQDRWRHCWTCRRPSQLRHLVFAMPVDDDEFVAAGMDDFGRPMLLRMSKAQGSWQAMNADRINGMTRLDGAVHLQDTLLLFGVREEAPRPTPKGWLDPMRVEVRCRKYDVRTWRSYDVVVAEDHGLEDVKVTDIALGFEHVVLVTNRRDVSVYEMRDDAGHFRLVRGPAHYDGDVAVRWLGGDTFRIGQTARTFAGSSTAVQKQRR